MKREGLGWCKRRPRTGLRGWHSLQPVKHKTASGGNVSETRRRASGLTGHSPPNQPLSAKRGWRAGSGCRDPGGMGSCVRQGTAMGKGMRREVSGLRRRVMVSKGGTAKAWRFGFASCLAIHVMRDTHVTCVSAGGRIHVSGWRGDMRRNVRQNRAPPPRVLAALAAAFYPGRVRRPPAARAGGRGPGGRGRRCLCGRRRPGSGGGRPPRRRGAWRRRACRPAR